MNLKTGIILGLFFGAFTGHTQEPGHQCFSEHLIQNNSFFSKIQHKPKTDLRNIDDIVIPVVVHIIYEEDSQNPSDQLIYTMVELLSADFSARNLDIDKVPPIFKPTAGSPQIEFCLASIDPAGNKTTGINRIKSVFLPGIDEMSDGRFRLFHTGLGGADAWDPDLYLNIYITPLPHSILGFATFPESRNRGLEDGVCIDYKEVFFGETTNSGRLKLGRTLTHEVGHWLGLTHIWGNQEGSCTLDDGVEDTPPQAYPYYNCPEGEKVSCGNPNAYMNYMDYTNDQCMYYFSLGQIDIMHRVLNEFRPLMGQLTLCGPNPFLIGRDIKLYPNPFNELIHIELLETAGKYADIRIYDGTGKLVLEKNLLSTGLIRLAADQLGQGFYVIQVKVAGTTYRFKTLKLN